MENFIDNLPDTPPVPAPPPPSTGRMVTMPSAYLPPVTFSGKSPSPTPKRGAPKGLIVGIAVAVALAGILGGGYYAYSRGLIRIPFLSPKTDQLFDTLVDKIADIKNAQYTARVTLAAEPRKAGATSIFTVNGNPGAEPVGSGQERDAQRKSDIAQLRTALALYYDDNSNKYPDAITGTTLTPGYITTPLTDPQTKEPYSYSVCNGGSTFVLSAKLESGETYFMTNSFQSGTAASAPECGAALNANANGNQSSFLQYLLPTAHAQVNVTSTNASVANTNSEPELAPTDSITSLPILDLINSFGNDGINGFANIVPTDTTVDASITAYTDTEKPFLDADALLKIMGSYSGGDLTAKFDLEGRKVGKNLYGIVRSFPSIPYIDISPLKDKWVAVTPEDDNYFLTPDTFKQEDYQNAVNEVKRGLKAALQAKVVTMDRKLGTDSIAGVQSEHYRIALHPSKLADAYRAGIESRKKDGKDAKDLEATLKLIEKPENLGVLQRFADNSTVEVWVDRVHGFLRQIQWTLNVVLPDSVTKLKGKQITVGVTLTLDKVNSAVSVDTPSPTINYDEATRILTGISEEQQKFGKQTSRVGDIRSALSTIKAASGSYPDSLDDLANKEKKAVDDCKARPQTNANSNGNTNGPLLIIPLGNASCGYYYGGDSPKQISITDVYTGKPYVYAKADNDFSLKYELKFYTPKDSYSSTYTFDGYIDGTNTANSTDPSIEKESSSEAAAKKYAEQSKEQQKAATTDTDGDGLTGSQETIYQTNPNKADTDGDGLTDYQEIFTYRTNPLKADTDGDGFSDKTEIDGGYNPNGSGKLGIITPSSVGENPRVTTSETSRMYEYTTVEYSGGNGNSALPITKLVISVWQGGKFQLNWNSAGYSRGFAFYQAMTPTVGTETTDPDPALGTSHSGSRTLAVPKGTTVGVRVAVCPTAQTTYDKTLCTISNQIQLGSL